MENMFDLMREEQEVTDAPGAGPLSLKRGIVEFQNVSFGYIPDRVVLKNISFTVPAGKTMALVSQPALLTYTVEIFWYQSNIMAHNYITMQHEYNELNTAHYTCYLTFVCCRNI